jgi:hypothetical protein
LKRTLEMKIRFTKGELDALTKKSRKAGLSREGYCRRVLNGSKEGRTTNRGMIRQDIDAAILASTTRQGFFKELRSMGYELKFLGKSGKPLKYPGLKPPGAKGFFRFHKLGADYTLEAIDYRILSKYVKLDPFSKEDRKLVAQNRAQNQPPYQKRVTGLRGLYLRYCYELHIIEKYPTSVKRVSFFLREDVAKLDNLDQQTRFLAENDIETVDQLIECRSAALSQIAQTLRRAGHQNPLRPSLSQRPKRQPKGVLLTGSESYPSRQYGRNWRKLRKHSSKRLQASRSKSGYRISIKNRARRDIGG